MNKKLQVWWIPQVPMKHFTVDVANLREAKLLLKTLARYDEFQFKNRIKPDYSNAGGLCEWNEETREWEDFYDEEGRGIDEIPDEELTGA